MTKERKSFFEATEPLERLHDEMFGLRPEAETLIEINKLVDFHSGIMGRQPYRIDEQAASYIELLDSIKESGIIEPLIVRKDSQRNGYYEIVSGHRRKTAAVAAGIEKIPCVIKDLTDDEAGIYVADGNIHRKSEELLPSEKAWAYRMKLEALKRQGKRSDLTSCQLDTKLRTDELLASEGSDSASKIQRYIRLTYLLPQLLGKVDAGKMPFMVGVELSYLTEMEQDLVLSVIDIEKVKVSLEQAQELKRMSKEAGEEGLAIDPIFKLLKKVKKAPEPKLNESYINRFVPEEIKKLSTMQKLAYTRAAIEHYNKWREENPEVSEEWTDLYGK